MPADRENIVVAPIDTTAYAARLLRDNAAGHCFICNIVRDEQPPDDVVVYRDEVCVAFFPNFFRLRGYVLLAPLDHRIDVVDGFTEPEYLALQLRVHRLGRVISRLVPTERLYVFSFGSHQGVSHVHWHLAPLPPGVPFENQQFAAVDKPQQLIISAEEMATLATSIGHAMRSVAI